MMQPSIMFVHLLGMMQPSKCSCIRDALAMHDSILDKARMFTRQLFQTPLVKFLLPRKQDTKETTFLDIGGIIAFHPLAKAHDSESWRWFQVGVKLGTKLFKCAMQYEVLCTETVVIFF
jgi:hypothetical protein